ncbi:MAG TPA: VCBS repeat-containing protein, partial [Pseudomonadales bacterium]|nr:VCBS repeat-containing protein [Pseudomonadales bacterium]
MALDVNGDGLTDLVPTGTATLLLNTGNGFTNVSYGSNTSGLTFSAAVAADYSGNGREDLLVPSTATGDWMRLASTGTGFAAPVDTGIASGDFGATPEVADSEGRMQYDLLGANGSGALELALRSPSYPDLLNQVVDGFGNINTLTWEPLSSDNVSVSNSWSGTFEIARRGHYLLASDQRNDGIGGSYTLSYNYDTPLTQAGVGFAGIYQVTATDGRDNETTTHLYRINKFASAIPWSVTVAQSNGVSIRESDYVYNLAKVIMKGQPLLLKSLTTTHYDLGGNPLDSVQRAYSYDASYMPDDIKITTTDLTTNDQWITETKRTNDEGTTTSDWCLNLANGVTVTDTLPSGLSGSRKTTYYPDLGHCRYNGEETNSNLAAALQVDTNYTYDNFGNIKTVQIIGYNSDGSEMPERMTKYNYDGNGEFRTQVTDAAGDITKASWNGALGVQATTTAANGSVTSYSYDGFGRPSRITLPTGAYSTLLYTICTNYCARWDYRVQTSFFDANGSQAGEQWDYYDGFGRKFEHAVKRQGGGIARSRVYYNALGQIDHQQSAPNYSG